MTRKNQKDIAKAVADPLPPVSWKPVSEEDKLRKARFLVKQFGNLKGRLLMRGGHPTLLAVSALLWGERVPKTSTAAHRLAKRVKRF